VYSFPSFLHFSIQSYFPPLPATKPVLLTWLTFFQFFFQFSHIFFILWPVFYSLILDCIAWDGAVCWIVFFQFSLSLNLFTVTQQNSSWNGASLSQRLHYGGLRERGIAQLRPMWKRSPSTSKEKFPFTKPFAECLYYLLFHTAVPSQLTFTLTATYFASKFLELAAGCLILPNDTTTALSFLLSKLFFCPQRSVYV